MDNNGKQDQVYGGARRLSIIAVTIILIAVVAASIMLSGVLDYRSDPSALAASCTLTYDSGTVEVQDAGSDDWNIVESGAILQAGTRIRTTATSEALITFFNGSTLKLEPNTDILIEQLEYDENNHSVIVIRQWIGTTWSRVVELVGPDSRYEIRTPSASALVRGTYFMVMVDEEGKTTVKVIEGDVIVTWLEEDTEEPENIAYDWEHGILVPAGYQVTITPGLPLSQSSIIPMESDDDTGTPVPNPSPTTPDEQAAMPTRTPVATCEAYITYSEHPGEYALVEAHRNLTEVAVQHGDILYINFQLHYIGPMGPILARPVVTITDSDSQLIRTYSMTLAGVLVFDCESVEPFPVVKGSTFVFNILWDLTDSALKYLPAGEYTIRASLETPDTEESNLYYMLDCTTPNTINVVIQ